MKISKLVSMSLLCLGLVGVRTSCYSMQLANPEMVHFNPSMEPFNNLKINSEIMRSSNLGSVKKFACLPIEQISANLKNTSKLNNRKISQKEEGSLNEFKWDLVKLLKNAVVGGENSEEDKEIVGGYLVLSELMNIAVDKFPEEFGGLNLENMEFSAANGNAKNGEKINENKIDEKKENKDEPFIINVDGGKNGEEDESVEKNEIKNEEPA